MTLSFSAIKILAIFVLTGISPIGDEEIVRSNEEICAEKFSIAVEKSLADKSIGEVIVSIGKSFEGTPYEAHAIEVPGDERLVIHMQGLDCVSLVENALTLSRCVKLDRPTFEEYASQLQLIRYRDGIIDGYPSRLHYFTDWIHDNEQKSVLQNVTRELGGKAYKKTIDFMSTHPDAYKQLGNADNLEAIRSQETALRSRTLSFIPKEDLRNHQNGIMNGDILAITTTVEGLDISHTGIALWIDKELRFLHAPTVGRKVETTESSLYDYLMKNKKHTGIMVARPVEPSHSQ